MTPKATRRRIQCVHHLFEAQVERSPDDIAAVFGEEQLTYRELDRRANQLAHHLQTLGVGPEVLVGICVERSLEMVIGLLGILKAGGAYLPLDPQLSARTVSHDADRCATPGFAEPESFTGYAAKHLRSDCCAG